MVEGLTEKYFQCQSGSFYCIEIPGIFFYIIHFHFQQSHLLAYLEKSLVHAIDFSLKGFLACFEIGLDEFSTFPHFFKI
jgi:hypothetical protein